MYFEGYETKYLFNKLKNIIYCALTIFIVFDVFGMR